MAETATWPEGLTNEALSDLAYSAQEEALSFGLSHETFLRYFNTIRDRALASAQAASRPAEPGAHEAPVETDKLSSPPAGARPLEHIAKQALAALELVMDEPVDSGSLVRNRISGDLAYGIEHTIQALKKALLSPEKSAGADGRSALAPRGRWVPVQERLPESPLKAVLVIMTVHSVGNHSHPGFGTDHWVRRTAWTGREFLAPVFETGEVAWWLDTKNTGA